MSCLIKLAKQSAQSLDCQYGRHNMKISIESLTKPGTFYTVLFHSDGSAECGCPHWQFRLKHKVAVRKGIKYRAECKHIQEARPFIKTAREFTAGMTDVVFTVTREMLY